MKKILSTSLFTTTFTHDSSFYSDVAKQFFQEEVTKSQLVSSNMGTTCISPKIFLSELANAVELVNKDIPNIDEHIDFLKAIYGSKIRRLAKLCLAYSHVQGRGKQESHHKDFERKLKKFKQGCEESDTDYIIFLTLKNGKKLPHKTFETLMTKLIELLNKKTGVHRRLQNGQCFFPMTPIDAETALFRFPDSNNKTSPGPSSSVSPKASSPVTPKMASSFRLTDSPILPKASSPVTPKMASSLRQTASPISPESSSQTTPKASSSSKPKTASPFSPSARPFTPKTASPSSRTAYARDASISLAPEAVKKPAYIADFTITNSSPNSHKFCFSKYAITLNEDGTFRFLDPRASRDLQNDTLYFPYDQTSTFGLLFRLFKSDSKIEGSSFHPKAPSVVQEKLSNIAQPTLPIRLLFHMLGTKEFVDPASGELEYLGKKRLQYSPQAKQVWTKIPLHTKAGTPSKSIYHQSFFVRWTGHSDNHVYRINPATVDCQGVPGIANPMLAWNADTGERVITQSYVQTAPNGHYRNIQAYLLTDRKGNIVAMQPVIMWFDANSNTHYCTLFTTNRAGQKEKLLPYRFHGEKKINIQDYQYETPHRSVPTFFEKKWREFSGSDKFDNQGFTRLIQSMQWLAPQFPALTQMLDICSKFDPNRGLKQKAPIKQLKQDIETRVGQQLLTADEASCEHAILSRVVQLRKTFRQNQQLPSREEIIGHISSWKKDKQVPTEMKIKWRLQAMGVANDIADQAAPQLASMSLDDRKNLLQSQSYREYLLAATQADKELVGAVGIEDGLKLRAFVNANTKPYAGSKTEECEILSAEQSHRSQIKTFFAKLNLHPRLISKILELEPEIALQAIDVTNKMFGVTVPPNPGASQLCESKQYTKTCFRNLINTLHMLQRFKIKRHARDSVRPETRLFRICAELSRQTMFALIEKLQMVLEFGAGDSELERLKWGSLALANLDKVREGLVLKAPEAPKAPAASKASSLAPSAKVQDALTKFDMFVFAVTVTGEDIGTQAKRRIQAKNESQAHMQEAGMSKGLERFGAACNLIKMCASKLVLGKFIDLIATTDNSRIPKLVAFCSLHMPKLHVDNFLNKMTELPVSISNKITDVISNEALACNVQSTEILLNYVSSLVEEKQPVELINFALRLFMEAGKDFYNLLRVLATTGNEISEKETKLSLLLRSVNCLKKIAEDCTSLAIQLALDTNNPKMLAFFASHNPTDIAKLGLVDSGNVDKPIILKLCSLEVDAVGKLLSTISDKQTLVKLLKMRACFAGNSEGAKEFSNACIQLLDAGLHTKLLGILDKLEGVKLKDTQIKYFIENIQDNKLDEFVTCLDKFEDKDKRFVLDLMLNMKNLSLTQVFLVNTTFVRYINFCFSKTSGLKREAVLEFAKFVKNSKTNGRLGGKVLRLLDCFSQDKLKVNGKIRKDLERSLAALIEFVYRTRLRKTFTEAMIDEMFPEADQSHDSDRLVQDMIACRKILLVREFLEDENCTFMIKGGRLVHFFKHRNNDIGTSDILSEKRFRTILAFFRDCPIHNLRDILKNAQDLDTFITHEHSDYPDTKLTRINFLSAVQRFCSRPDIVTVFFEQVRSFHTLLVNRNLYFYQLIKAEKKNQYEQLKRAYSSKIARASGVEQKELLSKLEETSWNTAIESEAIRTKIYIKMCEYAHNKKQEFVDAYRSAIFELIKVSALKEGAEVDVEYVTKSFVDMLKRDIDYMIKQPAKDQQSSAEERYRSALTGNEKRYPPQDELWKFLNTVFTNHRYKDYLKDSAQPLGLPDVAVADYSVSQATTDVVDLPYSNGASFPGVRARGINASPGVVVTQVGDIDDSADYVLHSFIRGLRAVAGPGMGGINAYQIRQIGGEPATTDVLERVQRTLTSPEELIKDSLSSKKV